MKILSALLLFAALILSGAEPLVIIFNQRSAIPSEKTAAKELQTFMQQITGREVVIREESVHCAQAAFYLGQTEFGSKIAPAFHTLGKEEWFVKAHNGTVVITGGRPRGVLYGVYEYLEKEYGVVFAACDTTIIPRRAFSVRKDLLLRGKPFMEFRSILWGGPGPSTGDCGAFLARTRNNYLTGKKYGGPWRFGSPGWCHTFHAYSLNFPKDKKEYFSLRGNDRIRSVNDSGPGQLCTSHPEVRELVWKNLCSFIEADRKKYADDPPTIYALDRNDNNMYCQCERCMKFVKEHGNLTDLHLDFINDIASRLKKKYPELRLMTMAYTYTLPPPENTRPLDNVIIQIANLGKEFSGGQTETLLPVQSARNDNFRKIFESWQKISKTIYVWDYWVLYGKEIHYPCFNVDRFTSDLRYFSEHNVRGYLAETQYQRFPFYAFRGWLASRLALDPFTDKKQLVDQFFDAYYGPASGMLKEYLALLQVSVEKEKKSIALTIPAQIGYLNKPFLDKTDRLLDAAEAACVKHPRELAHVQIERICVDMARLKLKYYDKTKRKQYVDRLLKELDVLASLYAYHANSRYRKEIAGARRMAESFLIDVEIPPMFRGKNICDFIWVDLPTRSNRQIVLTKDPDACGGCAVRMGGKFRLPFVAGIYDGNIRKRGPEKYMSEFPQDEKYHLYKIGTYDIRNNTFFHALPNSDFWMNLDRAYPNSPENICDLYASFKFTGPLYVKNSKQENAVWIDRVIIERKSGEKRTADKK